MEFKEFADKLFNKIRNWNGIIDIYDCYQGKFITFGRSEDKVELELCMNYVNSILTITIGLHPDNIYKFNLDELEYKRFDLNLWESIKECNKRTLDNFLEI